MNEPCVVPADDFCELEQVSQNTVMGFISHIQRFSVHDGPGIRTTVFFKGCPLRCLWCANPETQKFSSEVRHVDSLCNKCGRCLEVCNVKAITINDQGISIDRKLCTNCDECASVCDTRSLKIIGEEVSVDTLVEKIMRDWRFYRGSGGGVTFSGGEPLSQLRFLIAVSALCKTNGLSTALETSGCASCYKLVKAMQYIDLVLYDLKHMDSNVHKRVTGAPNELILSNARMIVEQGANVIFRVPLIPGINDTVENIKATCEFAVSLNNVNELHLLPYHRLGRSKYKMLDQIYQMEDLRPPSPERVEILKTIVEGFGLVCRIGG